ncbi:MAG: hypothetical protein KA252_02555 [Sphingorhabdus sp.]|nr:hypothetical protein [Sphingorhabdus sp.]
MIDPIQAVLAKRALRWIGMIDPDKGKVRVGKRQFVKNFNLWPPLGCARLGMAVG